MLSFDTTAIAATQTISGTENVIQTAGMASAGDAQEFLMYKRSASAPAHGVYFQSADGAYWEYWPGAKGVNVTAAGLLGGSSTVYGATEWNKAAAYARQWQSGHYTTSGPFINLFMPARQYRFNATINYDISCFGVDGYGADLSWAPGIVKGMTVEPSAPAIGAPFGNARSVLAGVTLNGPAEYASGQTGLYIAPTTYPAAHFAVRDFSIAGWQRGIQFGSNAYIIHFDNGNIYQNYYGMLDTVGATNAGENIHFIGVNSFDNQINGYIFTNVNASYSWHGCSTDNNGLGGLSNPDEANFSILGCFSASWFGCHFENSIKGMKFGGGPGNSGFPACLSGCAVVFTGVSTTAPNIDITSGTYFSTTSNMVFNNSTTVPIKLHSGAWWNNIGSKISYSGSVLQADSGSHAGGSPYTLIP